MKDLRRRSIKRSKSFIDNEDEKQESLRVTDVIA
jgi:hypothetical protein